jgi:hypothetical protein
MDMDVARDYLHGMHYDLPDVNWVLKYDEFQTTLQSRKNSALGPDGVPFAF